MQLLQSQLLCHSLVHRQSKHTRTQTATFLVTYDDLACNIDGLNAMQASSNAFIVVGGKKSVKIGSHNYKDHNLKPVRRTN